MILCATIYTTVQPRAAILHFERKYRVINKSPPMKKKKKASVDRRQLRKSIERRYIRFLISRKTKVTVATQGQCRVFRKNNFAQRV